MNALLVILAQSGCYVPCNNYKCTIFSKIIGKLFNFDNIEEGKGQNDFESNYISFLINVIDNKIILNINNSHIILSLDNIRKLEIKDNINLTYETERLNKYNLIISYKGYGNINII